MLCRNIWIHVQYLTEVDLTNSLHPSSHTDIYNLDLIPCGISDLYHFIQSQQMKGEFSLTVQSKKVASIGGVLRQEAELDNYL